MAMTDELLERVRASDPLPEGSTAPRYEVVLGQVRAAGGTAPRRRRPLRVLAPALSLASVLLVIGVSLAILGTKHGRHAPRPRTAIAVTHIPLPPPKGGMSGTVWLWGAGLSGVGTGVISLQQCTGCRGGGSTAHSKYRYWLLTTNDDGASWKLSARAYYIQSPEFDGRYGWAGGLQATGPGASGVAQYFNTLDGGDAWTVVPAAAPNEGGGVVSLSGGEVWAVGLANQVTILHASAGGSRLTATAAQPIGGGQTNVYVIAGGPGIAFVGNGDATREAARELFATHDDGRTWQQMTPPCPSGDTPTLVAARQDTVWADCLSPRDNSRSLMRSDDGGQLWQWVPSPSTELVHLQPVSSNVVWASTPSGEVFRSDSGGQRWQTVWSPDNPGQAMQSTRTALGVFPPVVEALSPSSATIFALVTQGGGRRPVRTNVVVYRTVDEGLSWRVHVLWLAGH
jgi:hypothetical protein